MRAKSPRRRCYTKSSGATEGAEEFKERNEATEASECVTLAILFCVKAVKSVFGVVVVFSLWEMSKQGSKSVGCWSL